ncbi:hypothetical protein ACOJIV_22740 [Haloarcula sp. AONF1]
MSAKDENEFGSAVEPGSDDDGRIDLEPGEEYIGEITDADFGVGSHGLIEVDGKTVWLNGRMRSQLLEALVVGEPVLHEKESEEQSFTDDDGEKVTYHNRNLRFVD